MHALKALLHARASPPTSPSLGPHLGPNLGPAWSTSAPARGQARSSTGLVSGFVEHSRQVGAARSGFVEHSRQLGAARSGFVEHSRQLGAARSGFVEHSRQVEAAKGNLYTHMQSQALRGLMTAAAAAAATTAPAAAAFRAADSPSTALQPSSSLRTRPVQRPSLHPRCHGYTDSPSTALQPSSSLPRLHVALPRAGAAPEIAGAALEIAAAARVGAARAGTGAVLGAGAGPCACISMGGLSARVGAGIGAVLGAGAGPCACISMGGLSPSSRPPPEMQPPEEEMRWRSRARPPAPERARELHSRARNLNRISMLLADEMLQVGSNKADGVADGVHVKADGVAGAAGAGAGAGVDLGLSLGTGLVPGGGRAAGGGRLGSSISLPSLPSHGSHPISSDLHRISLPSVGAAHRVGERLAAHSRSHLAPSERLAARERTGLKVNAPRLPPRLHRHQV